MTRANVATTATTQGQPMRTDTKAITAPATTQPASLTLPCIVTGLLAGRDAAVRSAPWPVPSATFRFPRDAPREGPRELHALQRREGACSAGTPAARRQRTRRLATLRHPRRR